MSYIPKYILKRMITKDAVKKVGNIIQIEVLNVISPISIDEIPNDDILDYLEVLIDGKALEKGVLKNIKIEFQGKAYGVEDVKSMVGVTIPVGEKLILSLPLDLEVGKEYDVTVTIKTNNPITINVQRTVN